MDARQKIWREFKQALANTKCLMRYTDNRRRRLRMYNIAIIGCSSVGAIGGAYNSMIAIIGASLVAVSAILKTAMPNIVQSEQELCSLDELMTFYLSYQNSIEELWYKYEKNIISERDMMNELFILKKNEVNKHTIFNNGVRSLSRKEKAAIDAACDNYINEVFFNTEQND